MLLEKEQKNILEAIGPFEQAKTNIERFAWNHMILYTVVTLVKTYEYIAANNDEKMLVTKVTADATLMGVFQLILEKKNNMWD